MHDGKIFLSPEKPHWQGEDLIYLGLKFKFKHLNFYRFHQAMQPKPINYILLFYLLNPFLSPESYIKNILTIFSTISTIDNRLREKSLKKSVISAIYRRYIGFRLIYHGNIGFVTQVRVSLIFR